MAPPRWGYRPGITGEVDEIIDELYETPEEHHVLLVPKRSRRRHDREMKIRHRMREAQDLMFLYQPGIYYGSIDDLEPGFTWRSTYPSWFVPGRFAKIHPMRVCSCMMCKGDRDENKRNRRKVRMDLKRLGEDYIDTEWSSDW